MGGHFLGVRLGAMEKSYFRKEDELAAAKVRKKLIEKNGTFSEGGGKEGARTKDEHIFLRDREASGDVLPEILQHSLRLSMPTEPQLIRKTLIQREVEGIDKKVAESLVKSTLQPFGHVPETRLGRSRYAFNMPQPSSFTASTANELRQTTVDKTRVKNLMRGFTEVSKAFGVATLLVYGGGAVAVWLTFHSLGVTHIEEIPEKVKQKMKPSVEKGIERLEPLRQWLKSKAEGWKIKEEDRLFIGSKLAQSLGLNATSIPTLVLPAAESGDLNDGSVDS